LAVAIVLQIQNKCGWQHDQIIAQQLLHWQVESVQLKVVFPAQTVTQQYTQQGYGKEEDDPLCGVGLKTWGPKAVLSVVLKWPAWIPTWTASLYFLTQNAFSRNPLLLVLVSCSNPHCSTCGSHSYRPYFQSKLTFDIINYLA
jgi:hypothetical protein